MEYYFQDNLWIMADSQGVKAVKRRSRIGILGGIS
jgi:hypothetical protein